MVSPPLPTVYPRLGAAAPPACGIAAHAHFAAPLSAVSALRDAPLPAGCPPLPPRFLRHCDEHTVVGIHALLRVIAGRPGRAALHDDAIVAASCQAGRLMAAKSLAQLKTGGAVTVSTHIVPQASLHSLAGAASVALGMHGPHLGVSGGPGALAEGIVAAVTLVQAAGVPRAWLVVTEWDEEPALDPQGTPLGDPLVRAVALAVEPGDDSALSIDIRSPEIAGEPGTPGSLAAFSRALDMCGSGGALVAWTLACPWGAEVRIMRRRPATRSAPRPLREAA